MSAPAPAIRGGYITQAGFGPYLESLRPQDVDYPNTVSEGYGNAIIEAYAQKHGFRNEAQIEGDAGRDGAIYNSEGGITGYGDPVPESRRLAGNLLRRKRDGDRRRAVGFLYRNTGDSTTGHIEGSRPADGLQIMFNEFARDPEMQVAQIFRPIIINRNHWVMCEIYLTKKPDGKITVNRHYYDPLYRAEVEVGNDRMVIACANRAFGSNFDRGSRAITHNSKKQSDSISCGMVPCWYLGNRLAGEGREDSIDRDIGAGTSRFPKDAKALRLYQMRLRQQYPQKVLDIYLNDSAWQIHKSHTRPINEAKLLEVTLRDPLPLDELAGAIETSTAAAASAKYAGAGSGKGSTLSGGKGKTDASADKAGGRGSAVEVPLIDRVMSFVYEESLRDSGTAAFLRDLFQLENFVEALGEGDSDLLAGTIDSYFMEQQRFGLLEPDDADFLGWVAVAVVQCCNNSKGASSQKDILDVIKDRDTFLDHQATIVLALNALRKDKKYAKHTVLEAELKEFEGALETRSKACVKDEYRNQDKVFIGSKLSKSKSWDKFIWSYIETFDPRKLSEMSSASGSKEDEATAEKEIWEPRFVSLGEQLRENSTLYETWQSFYQAVEADLGKMLAAKVTEDKSLPVKDREEVYENAYNLIQAMVDEQERSKREAEREKAVAAKMAARSATKPPAVADKFKPLPKTAAARPVSTVRVERTTTDDPKFARNFVPSASAPQSSAALPDAVSAKIYQAQKEEFAKTIWENEDRGGKFRVMGVELSADEVTTLLSVALINAMKASGVVAATAIAACDYAMRNGGIASTYDVESGKYKRNEDTAVQPGWKDFSAKFQQECKAMGIFTGRENPKKIVGMRLTFLPKTALENFAARGPKPELTRAEEELFSQVSKAAPTIAV